jgi:branched-chain amino acid transport system ATP-binding protein
MDEPMEGLAPIYVQAVANVILQLKQGSSISMLLVIPELALALRLADQICVMTNGNTVFVGSPGELENRPDIQARYIGVGQ